MAVRLFVGGLTPAMSAEQLRAMFAAYGAVESVTVPIVRDTTKSRPFAFVDMETLEGAEVAIRNLHGRTIDGRRIRVEKTKPRPG